MKKLVMSGLSVAILAASQVHAAEINTTAGPVVGLNTGLLMPDGSRDLNRDAFFDIYGGYRFGPAWEATLAYVTGSFDGENVSSDADLDSGIMADVRYHFSNSSTQPYLGLGVSEFDYDYDNGVSADGDMVLSAAMGVKEFFTPSFFINGEIKQILDSDEGDTFLKVGLGYVLGQSGSTPVAAPAPAPAPAPKPAPAPVVVADSDNDGVADNLDQCPSTPAGAPVDSVGCPLDSDNDGVADYKDECPDTVAGAEVDAGGCEIKFVDQKESLEIRVTFDTNSANLTAGSNTEIKRAADFMATYSNATLVVEGHTDNTGAAAYNKSLSQRRADAVRTVLITEFGVDPARVTAVGVGEEKPIADNATAAGRQANRRVVGVVEGQKSVRVKQGQ